MADTTDLDSLTLDQLQALRAQMLSGAGGGGASSAPASTAPATAAPATSAPSGPIAPAAAPSAPASTPRATPSASSVTLAPGQSLDDLSLDQLQQMRAQMLAANPNAASAPAAPESSYDQRRQQLLAAGYKPNPAMDWLSTDVAGPIQGYAEQAIRGATMGISDKVEAAKSALTDYLTGANPSFGDAYQKALTDQRAMGNTYAQNHPIASPIATGTGMVLTLPLTAVGGGTVEAPAVVGQAVQAGKVAAPVAATLGARALQAAKTGAIVGGAAGFGNSNDTSITGDLASTAGGAAVGGAAGGVGSIAADKIVSPIANWAARWFNPEGAANNQAIARIAQRISQDKEGGGPGAQDILDSINAAPPNEQNTIADFGGGNVLGEAGRVVRAPGPGKTVGLNLLVGRAKQEPQTVANLVQSNISAGGPVYDATQALMEARQAAAAPKYEAAGIPNDPAQYAQAPVVDNPAVNRLLQKSTAIKSAIANAKGLPDYADLPDNSIVTLDKAYKAIGGSAAEATRAGNGEAARDLNSLRVQLKNAITQSVPAYGEALNAFSGPSASLDAVKAGQGFLTKDPAEVADEIKNLAPGDKEFYKLGAAQTLINNAENTGRSGNAVSRIAQSVRAQKQLEPLFDSTDDYNNFVAGINRANTRMETKTATIGNSATAGRIAENEGEQASNPFLAGAAEAGAGALTGESIPVATGAFNMVKGLTSNGPPRSPAVNKAIATMLFNPDQAAQRQTIEQIIAAQQRPQWSRGAAIPLASLAGAHPGAVAVGALTPAQALARHFLGGEE